MSSKLLVALSAPIAFLVATASAPAAAEVPEYPRLAWKFNHSDPNEKGVGYSQCNPRADQGYVTKGRWLYPDLLIDTTTDWGGCVLGLAIQDPAEYFGQVGHEHTYIQAKWENRGAVKTNQCGDFDQKIPHVTATGPYFGGGLDGRFDTDENRPGPCRVTFSIPKTAKVNIQFGVSLKAAPGADPSQCVKLGSGWDGNEKIIGPGGEVSFEIDTDGKRPGGCLLAFKFGY